MRHGVLFQFRGDKCQFATLNSANLGASTVTAIAAQPARAADGDYKARSALTSQTKDADGDYKAAQTPAAKTSSAVQAALTNLVKGG